MIFKTESEAWAEYGRLINEKVEFTVRHPVQLQTGEWYLPISNVWER